MEGFRIVVSSEYTDVRVSTNKLMKKAIKYDGRQIDLIIPRNLLDTSVILDSIIPLVISKNTILPNYDQFEKLNFISTIPYIVFGRGKGILTSSYIGLPPQSINPDKDGQLITVTDGVDGPYMPPNKVYRLYNGAAVVIKELLDIQRLDFDGVVVGSIEDLLITFLVNYFVHLSRTLKGEFFISYSGGIDSTLLLLTAREAGVQLKPISIFTIDSTDYRDVRKILKLIEWDGEFIEIIPTKDEVVEALEITEKIKIYSPILVPVSVAEFILLSKIGSNVLIMGQGADELFGGYDKYRRLYPNFQGERSLDLFTLHLTTGRIEWLLSNHTNTLILYPYLSIGVKYISQRQSRDLMVKNSEDYLRKWVIRRALLKLGVPKEVYLRRKKAMQYSSGLKKMVRKIVNSQN